MSAYNNCQDVQQTISEYFKCHDIQINPRGRGVGRGTYVSQVEGDLQVPPEVLGELGVHVQHLLNVLSQDLVEVAVGQGAHVRVGLAGPRVKVDGLAEDVVLP